MFGKAVIKSPFSVKQHLGNAFSKGKFSCVLIILYCASPQDKKKRSQQKLTKVLDNQTNKIRKRPTQRQEMKCWKSVWSRGVEEREEDEKSFSDAEP